MKSEITPQEMQKLKEIEIKMLDVFVDICEKLHLKYFLVDGTLLGAVRHKGFIPWDDDIDVGMLRSDYEIFVKKAPQYLSEDYFLQTFESDPEYPYVYAKIRNCRTTFIETVLKDLHINHGVFIDIFPFDFYPENKVKIKKIELEKKIMDLKIESAYHYDKPLKHSAIGRTLQIISKIKYKSVSTAVKKRDKLIQCVKSSSIVCNYCGDWEQKESVPTEWLSEFIQLEFEGKTYSAPKNYHEILTRVYGNYMELPPEEKRVPQHYTEVIDLDMSYSKYYK